MQLFSVVQMRKLRLSGMKLLAQGHPGNQWLRRTEPMHTGDPLSIHADPKNGVWAHLHVLWQMQRIKWCVCSGRLESSGETAFYQAILVLSCGTRAIIETGAKDHGRGELQVWDCAAGSPCCPLSRAKETLQLNDTHISRDITLPTKVRLVKAMVFLVVMYGCESWSVKKAERWKIDAFELWCWRRLLRVPWTARISNQP